MDVNKLVSFVTVFAHRSFTKAAGELGLSQPTISEHIRTLEEELGCRLFDRLGRKIIPTGEAEGIYQRALRIIQEADGLKNAASRISGNIEGALLIGASTIPGTYILPSLFQGFRETQPGVSLEVRIGDSQQVTQMVRNNEIVMGLTGAVMEPERLNYQSFIGDEMILVSSPSLSARNRITVKDIPSLPFVIRERGSGTRKIMEEFLEAHGIAMRSLNIAAVLGSTDCVKQAVKSSIGMSFISRVAVMDELKFGALIEIPIQGGKLKRNFHIVTHKKRALPAKYAAFIDYMTGSGT